MLEYGFSLTRIFPYKDRIVDFVLIRENTGQRKFDTMDVVFSLSNGTCKIEALFNDLI